MDAVPDVPPGSAALAAVVAGAGAPASSLVVVGVAGGFESPQASIRLFLKYGPRGENVISGLERVSRPGRRVYLGRAEVPKVMGGLGTSILTTSRGVMTGREAVKAGVGGEVLCNIW